MENYWWRTLISSKLWAINCLWPLSCLTINVGQVCRWYSSWKRLCIIFTIRAESRKKLETLLDWHLHFRKKTNHKYFLVMIENGLYVSRWYILWQTRLRHLVCLNEAYSWILAFPGLFGSCLTCITLCRPHTRQPNETFLSPSRSIKFNRSKEQHLDMQFYIWMNNGVNLSADNNHKTLWWTCTYGRVYTYVCVKQRLNE